MGENTEMKGRIVNVSFFFLLVLGTFPREKRCDFSSSEIFYGLF